MSYDAAIASAIIGVNLRQNRRLETASTRNKTHLCGFQTLNLTLVRGGGRKPV
ncbi:hypothetical protein H6G97_10815 [Nostoc flagelliforme FACHB-838]|uniref:Transposase n=1 Tax=Nostoc flagelliforme FACHB-838 TaxID=2692904 RepID=A0ABR8DL93_9NOSO|nr:hypothetical protein [Nostoc flagelliforme]MBD2530033.1 hypothetical protein [Nostoc flagelliforme FACHB-838]